MSESNNKTTETESERSEHHKYRQVWEKLWPWLYLNENKMFCKVCMKAGKTNTMTIGCTTFKTSSMTRHEETSDYKEAMAVPSQQEFEKSCKQVIFF
jgi:hypothetical protein